MAKKKRKNRKPANRSQPPKAASRSAAPKSEPKVAARRPTSKKNEVIRNPNSRSAQRAIRARKARRDRFILIATVTAIVAAVVGLVVFTGGDEVGVTEAVAFDLPALDGGEDDSRFLLADYRGTPLVVNFFASWCTACESELPRFRDAAEQFDDDLEILFVNSNETGNWRPMAERTGIISQPLVKDINGSNGNGLYRSLGGSGGMPLTAFYDADGNVIHVDRGELSTDALTVRLQQFYELGV